ncbi:MAG: hypothetical protein AAB605_01160 [Patescibacteria group bacterium]
MDFSAVTGIITGIPFDWLALGGLAVLFALDSLRSGIGRACALALALPIAAFLFSFVEKTVILSGIEVLFSSPTAQAATFGAVSVASYLIVRRMALEYVESGTGEPIQALLAGVAATIVIIVVWLQVPALDALWHLNDSIAALFSESYRLLWLLGAYAALAFARG